MRMIANKEKAEFADPNNAVSCLDMSDLPAIISRPCDVLAKCLYLRTGKLIFIQCNTMA